jgi:hypothetical protein
VARWQPYGLTQKLREKFCRNRPKLATGPHKQPWSKRSETFLPHASGGVSALVEQGSLFDHTEISDFPGSHLARAGCATNVFAIVTFQRRGRGKERMMMTKQLSIQLSSLSPTLTPTPTPTCWLYNHFTPDEPPSDFLGFIGALQALRGAPEKESETTTTHIFSIRFPFTHNRLARQHHLTYF